MTVNTALSLLFVLTAVATVISAGEVKYYTTQNQTALAKVVQDGRTITDCYLFADGNVISTIMENVTEVAEVVNKRRFKAIRRQCLPTQEREIPKRIRAKRARLRRMGRDRSARNRRKNTEARKAAAAERARRRGRNNRNRGNNRGNNRNRGNNNSRGGRRGRSQRDRERRSTEEESSMSFADYLSLLLGIYPGTLWCGAGNLTGSVETEDGLGEKKALDACCRVHDHCPKSINGFSTAFGVTNYSPITCSDCDCDELFKSCLKAAMNSDADLVGDVFFDILDLNCVKKEYPWMCVDYDWTGFFCTDYARNSTAEKVHELYDGIEYD